MNNPTDENQLIETEYMSFGDIENYVQEQIRLENPEFFKKQEEDMQKIHKHYLSLLPEEKDKILNDLINFRI